MAYKFQLGDARLSGSLVQEGDITAESSKITGIELNLPDNGIKLNSIAVTATATELNKLDGFTGTTADLNLVDNAVAGTVVNSKAVIYSAAGHVNAVQLSASAALKGASLTLDGVDLTATATELNQLDGVTLGDIVTQNSNSVNIDGGFIDGTEIGKDSQSYGKFTYVSASQGLTGALAHSISAGQGIQQFNFKNGADVAINISSSIAGNGLSWNAGVIDLNLQELSTTAVAVADDSYAFIDFSDSNNPKKAKISDLMTAVAGDGLGASSGVLAVKVSTGGGLTITNDELEIAANGIKDSMIDWGTSTGQVSTADIPEQTNLYYTDARARLAMSVSDTPSIDMSYNSATGVVSGNVKLDSSNALVIEPNGLDLKATIAGPRTFSNDITMSANLSVAGDLQVNGALTYVNTTNLAIKDALITVGSGSSAFQTGYGFELGAVGAGWGSFKTAKANIDGVSPDEDIFQASHPISASALAATDVYASTLHGQLVGSFLEAVSTFSAGNELAQGVNIEPGVWVDGAQVKLPAGAAIGTVVRVKKAGNTNRVEIIRQGSDLVEGVTSITLESSYAAVSIIKCKSTEWMVF